MNDSIIVATEERDSFGGIVRYYRTTNGNYSWGWIVDDFGNMVMPYWQVAGFGLWESANDTYA